MNAAARRILSVMLVSVPLWPAAAGAQTAYEQLQAFSSLLSQIRLNYVDSVGTAHLVRGAITGMLASLDPHSYYMPAADGRRWEAWLAGDLAGAGLLVEDVDGTVTVQSVLTGSSGAQAGVSAGDRLLSVNDTLVAGFGAPHVQTRLVGERGTRIRLVLERGSRLEPETVRVRLRFDMIQPEPVSIARILPSGAGYVRLEQFLPTAARDVRDAVNRVVRGTPRRLILDLRGNPGGLVHASVELAQQFLPRRTLVFRTEGRRRATREEFFTDDDGPFRDVQLVLLVDEHSASAAEALAASFQDHDRAVIAGRRTFGKALMQQTFLLPPTNDVVRLTVGYVLSPRGRLIQRRYRGLNEAQYVAARGSAGADADTVREYRTAAGRVVRGGGGVRPDVFLPPPAPLPAWFVAAADSGYHHAIADSVAGALAADAATRAAWLSDPARWHRQVVLPFLDRVRLRLGVRALPDSAVTARLGLLLGARVVEVRWGNDAAEDFRLRHDADVAAAEALFPRLALLLAPRPD